MRHVVRSVGGGLPGHRHALPLGAIMGNCPESSPLRGLGSPAGAARLFHVYDGSFSGGAVAHCTHLQRHPRRAHESTRDIAMPYCAPSPPGTRFRIINNTIVHRPADARGSHSDEVALPKTHRTVPGKNKGRSRSRTSPSDSLSHPLIPTLSAPCATPSRFSNGQSSPLSPGGLDRASKFACGLEAGILTSLPTTTFP